MEGNKNVSLRDEFFKDTMRRRLDILKERHESIISDIKKRIHDSGDLFFIGYDYNEEDIAFILSNNIDVIPVMIENTPAHVLYWGKKEELEQVMIMLGFTKGDENSNDIE